MDEENWMAAMSLALRACGTLDPRGYVSQVQERTARQLEARQNYQGAELPAFHTDAEASLAVLAKVAKALANVELAPLLQLSAHGLLPSEVVAAVEIFHGWTNPAHCRGALAQLRSQRDAELKRNAREPEVQAELRNDLEVATLSLELGACVWPHYAPR